jgi:hypothetical protein
LPRQHFCTNALTRRAEPNGSVMATSSSIWRRKVFVFVAAQYLI